MERRPIIYGYEQARTFDYLSGVVYALEGDSRVALDMMGGAGTTVVSGGAVSASTPADMVVNIAPLSIYELAPVDVTAYGAIASNTTQILQIGHNPLTSQVVLSASGLSSGQSMWALISATLLVADSIAQGDPNGGLLLYYNPANPSQPYQGQNNNGGVQNTLRSNTVALTVTYGVIAPSGAEIPPLPSAGSAPLYLVNLIYGQTQVVNILTAGPSVGVNVPSNYPSAPFLAGLLNSHHSGVAGQAPKINLATEVQGILPLANLGQALAGVAPIAGSSSQVFNVATAVSSSEAVPLGQAQADFALIAGSSSQVFNVGRAVSSTEAVPLGQFVNSFNPNGYIKLPGGLIIQWGIAPASTVGTAATNTVNIVFPIAFPSGVLSAHVSVGGVGVAYGVQGGSETGIVNLTTSGGVVQYANYSGATYTYQSSYLVVGY